MAAAISLPALHLWFQNDDHAFRLAVSLGAPRFLLFTLPDDLAHMQWRNGLWAWWASPELRFNFLRPLASWMHAWEFEQWRDSPHWMLAMNVGTYAACAGTAAGLYRRLHDTASYAVLAGWMFALHSAHALSVGWISSRNTLLALLFSLWALWIYVVGRTSRRPWLQALVAVPVALALLSSESGVWSLSFLLAYAVAFDSGSWRSRTASLVARLQSRRVGSRST